MSLSRIHLVDFKFDRSASDLSVFCQLRLVLLLVHIKMKSTATQYEELAQQIECILQNPEAPDVSIPDEQIRRRLADGGRKLSILLEEPRHTMSRLEHVVLITPPLSNGSFQLGSNLDQHFQLPLAIIGADTGLFAALAAEPRPSTSTELSQKTGVTLSLLSMLLFSSSWKPTRSVDGA